MDGFIDDIPTITIDYPIWAERTKNSELLGIHTIFRPLHSSEQLKRDDPLPIHKLSVEGQLVQHKKIMGWDIQTRSLRVFTPKEKETAWVKEIGAYLSSTKVKTENMESLI